MQHFSLLHKRAVITGAASGIGRAIAREFARAGAEVVLLDLHSEPALAAATAIAAETGARASSVACDVSDEASVDAAFDTIASGPDSPIDILVNSAGIAHIGTVVDTPLDDFDRLFGVNVRGTFLCMRAALRSMQARKSGVILNLASIAATSALSQRFAYSMTKGAVLAMTLSTAKDCLPFSVRCNCISPARVHTPFVDGYLARNYPGQEAEMMQTLAASQPIGRMGTPEEIALLALYLCSDAAGFVTGSDFPIDGGFTRLR